MPVQTRAMLKRQLKMQEDQVKCNECNECDECVICYELLKEDICDIKCGHRFHNGCLKQMTNDLCPLCRTEMCVNIVLTEPSISIQTRERLRSTILQDIATIELNSVERHREMVSFEISLAMQLASRHRAERELARQIADEHRMHQAANEEYVRHQVNMWS